MRKTAPSSSGNDSDEGVVPKKRRLPGACDLCRKKKVRCDSAQMKGMPCSNCVAGGLDCTHAELAKNLGPARGYVENLELRLEKMQALLEKLLPGVDIEGTSPELPAPMVSPPTRLPRNDDEEATDSFVIKFKTLYIDPPSQRFFGKSSQYHIVQTLVNESNHYVGAHTSHWANLETRMRKNDKRPEYWTLRSWQEHKAKTPHADYQFPPSDLMCKLIDLYFRHANAYLPFLHRPTFEQLISRGKHRTDSQFGAVVLLTCAVGARFSDDPRVFMMGDESLPQSAGWMWFDQVTVIRPSVISRTTLYELQMYILAILYGQATGLPAGWILVGIALRLAQDVGAHRRKTSSTPNAEDELWKRAFWALFFMDRVMSSYTGRPCTLHDEDFDQEYPTEVDDENWEKGFQQPAGKPSSVTSFVQMIKLMEILGHIMIAIYGVRKSDPLSGRETRTDIQVITDLDSAMNAWLENLPDFLRWDSNRQNGPFSRHSAYLLITFYHLRIFCHRPFIPTPHSHSPLSFTSLAMCTNSARSIASLVESKHMHDAIPITMLHVHGAVFSAAVVLLLSTWTHRRSQSTKGTANDLMSVHICMDHLSRCEKRWNNAGKLWDIIAELTAAGESMFASRPKHVRNKRPRHDSDEDEDEDESLSRTGPSSEDFSSSDVSIFTPQSQPSKSPNNVPAVPADASVYDGMEWSGLVNGLNPVPPSFNRHVADPSMIPLPPDEVPQYPSQPTEESDADLAAFFSQFPSVDNTTMSMWSQTPLGYEFDDWGPYIDSFTLMTAQGQQY